eukprot:CAMPEP_0197521412 /NCGR_PEP_ID=MMETSP1318-20131121/6688_1 /TAXON_ID=552666 /ORGANISM="Partenskyella glossopodia, Strain RCC365" /LENGTH=195 /DNA_ID=CAMNT_0043073403 /DNA_START=201 /DNA_END=788 /DNA_ORIENTATION=+
MMDAALPLQEWYGMDDSIIAFIQLMAKASHVIHDLGCGQSQICERLRALGYQDLSGSDFSKVLIDKRNEEEKKRAKVQGERATRIKYITCDLRTDIPVPAKSVDLVIDKATLDAIAYRRNESARDDVKKVLGSVSRILKPGGRILSISLNNDAIFNEYCIHPDFEPARPTAKIVTKIQGRSEPANVYIRRLKLRE